MIVICTNGFLGEFDAWNSGFLAANMVGDLGIFVVNHVTQKPISA